MRYGVVKATFWTDPKVEGLSLHAKALFLHLLTCPELTIVGLVNASPGLMGYRMGMDTPSVLLAMKELEGIGAVKSDYDNQVFWLVNFVKHNPPTGPKQIAGCKSCLKLYEFTPLAKALSKHYQRTIQGVSIHQEQVQEHEQEHDHEQERKPTLSASDTASTSAVLTVPLKGGGSHTITQQDVDRYCELYPLVDIMAELRKLVGWNEAAPERKRKMPSGVKAHIARWLADKQDKSPKPIVWEKVPEDPPGAGPCPPEIMARLNVIGGTK